MHREETEVSISQKILRNLTLAACVCVAVALPPTALAQEAVPPPQQTITDFSPREIAPDKRVVMSQGTEMVEGVDASGVPQFKVDPFWPLPLPNNWVLGQVSGVYVDNDDHVWITHRPGSLSDREVGVMMDPPINKCCFPAPPVVQFDQEGNLVSAWGGPGEGYDWPSSEHGIHVDDDGFVWVAGNGDEDRHILKFFERGRVHHADRRTGRRAGQQRYRQSGQPRRHGCR